MRLQNGYNFKCVVILLMYVVFHGSSHSYAETKTPEQIQKELWKTSHVAAFAEARRRIANHQPGGQLNFWDLGALEMLPKEIAQLIDLQHFRTPNGSKLSSIAPLMGTQGITSLSVQRRFLNDISNFQDLKELHIESISNSRDYSDWSSIDISPISNLTNLTKLSLSDLYPSNLGVIRNLQKLKEFSLILFHRQGRTPNILDISYLSELENLEKVTIFTSVKDLTPFSKTPHLRELWLIGSGAKDLSPLSELRKLEKLFLESSGASDLEPLENLISLRELSIINSPVEFIGFLGGLINLETLDLDGTRVSNIWPLQGLTKLKELNLRKTPVKNIDALAGLSRLQKLRLPFKHNIDLDDLDGLKKRGTIIE